MTTPNAALAYEVLDAIDAHRAHFSMGAWAYVGEADYNDDLPIGIEELTGPTCGTTACFAGWALALRGYRFNEAGEIFRDGEYLDGGIEDHAAHLLGISMKQAGLFFVDDEEIAEAVAEVFGPRPERAP